MNRYAALVALAGFAAACNGDDCDTATETCDTDTTCENAIDEVFPAAGETGVYYRTAIEVTLDEEEADASITLSDANGDVAGTSSVSGDVITFTPDAALAPNTEYTITVNYSCGAPQTSFTTSEVGAAAETTDIEGNVYSLDLASGRFVEPAGIGAILGDFLDQQVLIGVQSASSTEIQMIGALGEGEPPAQGTCDPTIDFPVADFAGNPFFQIGPETTTLAVAGYTVTIDDLEISGAFAPDASYIAGAVLAGTIDTRPLVPLLDADSDCSEGYTACTGSEDDPADCCDENAICATAVQIGVACETCADGEDFCLSLYVDSMTAAQVAGGEILPQHLPVDDATAPAESTNICDIAECSGAEECLAAVDEAQPVAE